MLCGKSSMNEGCHGIYQDHSQYDRDFIIVPDVRELLFCGHSFYPVRKLFHIGIVAKIHRKINGVSVIGVLAGIVVN